VSAPLYGKLSDLYGRKPAFIASISIFLAGSALCGFAASMGQLIAFRVVMGLGVGLVMPNLTTAIQNAVPRRDLGAATAAAAFFRSLGGALGAALAGAVLAAHLHGAAGDAGALSGGVLQIAELPAGERALVLEAYRAGLTAAFTVGAVIAGLGFLTVLFLPKRPLRGATA
jgi:MFS family permease